MQNVKHHITTTPLSWPDGWVRTKSPISSRFGKYNKPVTIAQATNFTLQELDRMGVPDYRVIISTNLQLRLDGLPYSNQKEPADKGAAVWWSVKDDYRVIALDKYDRIADNIYAIGKTIEAMRGIERWGGAEILSRTFTGFIALPASASSWRTILGCQHAVNLNEIEVAYKKARLSAHPDKGGNEELFHAVNKAWEEAQKEFK